MIELTKYIRKNVDLDELCTEIFLIFQFDTLFIDLSVFAFGQYFYRFSRSSAILWSGGSIGYLNIILILIFHFLQYI